MSADSPVTGFAVKTSGGQLEAAGSVFDSAPYGWPVKKGSPLAQSLQKALEHLIETGDYKAIASNWGVEQGMITKPVINGWRTTACSPPTSTARAMATGSSHAW